MPYSYIRETHTGIVVFVGDRAFKVKKPIRTHFLDFRTAAQRECACVREVELNSRLSPDSYLGVAHLSDPTGGPAEPIVVMRRYRDDTRLASLIARGLDESVQEILDSIARELAGFHARSEHNPEIDAEGKVCAVDGRWHENLSELNSYVGEPFSELSFQLLARVQRLAGEYVLGRDSLFARRIEEGCIVNGHGDLLANDIFSGPTAGRRCSTASSSTTNYATSTVSTTRPSWQWIWSFWAGKTSRANSSSVTSSNRGYGTVVVMGLLHRL